VSIFLSMSVRVIQKALLILLAFVSAKAFANSCHEIWDRPSLVQAPVMRWVDTSGSVHSLLFEGIPYKQARTEVYALYSDPGVLNSGDGKEVYPAILLLHGGGGKAFPHWVEQWARRGFAAMAIDLGGPDNPSPTPGPQMGNQLNQWHLPVEERWFYHAPANVMLAHSLLRSMPKADPDRTAIMGISWGGFLTCLVVGLDDRFSAAVSVYGTGSLYQGTRWEQRFQLLGEGQLNDWKKRWDPIAHLPDSEVPLLIVNGDADPFFHLEATHRTISFAPSAQLLIIPDLHHSHGSAFALDAPVEFINNHLLHCD
jgi:dipeptidyl aminopeptidase/acylaminoacyl peptidase